MVPVLPHRIMKKRAEKIISLTYKYIIMTSDGILFSGLAGALVFGGYFLYLKHTSSEEYKKKYPWKFDYIWVWKTIAPIGGGIVGIILYYLFNLITAN